MAYDKFLIAPLSSGMQTSVKPWLISDDAYSILNNAYNWRGRVRKRFGTRFINGSVDLDVQQLSSRVRVAVGMTDGAGNANGTVMSAILAIGQAFSIGNTMFTVIALGNPAAMIGTGPFTAATFDTTTGAFVFTGTTPGTTVYFYPSQPIMGIETYENGGAINSERTIVFDTQFAYEYTGAGYDSVVGVTPLWHGTDYQFFESITWRGSTPNVNYLFVVNSNAPTDTIQYFDGTTWFAFTPILDAVPTTLTNAALVITFANRLLFFNVWETQGIVTTNFPGKIDYSAPGQSVETNAFNQGNGFNGGSIFLPVSERIVGIDKLRNRLLVFGERSSWELIDTGNLAVPFTWNEINPDFGCESSNSVISFDKETLYIGETGIFSCNGTNVDRIDLAILQQVFEIQNTNNGVLRVAGIRDYVNEMVYWSYPESERDVNYFPSKILVYNYINQTWSLNDDSFTALGYWEDNESSNWLTQQKTWAQSLETWDDEQETASNLLVIAGNQQGFVVVIDPSESVNALSLQITAIAGTTILTVTIYNHNLETGDYIYINFVTGTGTLSAMNDTIYEVLFVDQNNISIANTNNAAGNYAGGGVAGTVSKIDIWTKQYNFYQKQARNMQIPMIDFNVDTTSTGEITIDYYTSFSLESRETAAIDTGTSFGTSVLETFPYPVNLAPWETGSTQVWHRQYIQAEGEVIQLRLYYSNNEMLNAAVRDVDFQLNAVLYYSSATQRLQ